MTTGIRAFFAGAIALSVLSAMPRCARAAFVDTQISAFADGQTSEHVLGLATASDKSQKTAALIIRGPDPSKDEYKPRAAFFSDPHQWDQLVALWNKARLTRPPKRTNINGDSVKVGSYFDGTSAALLQMFLDIKEFCARFFKFTCEKSDNFSFNFLLFREPLDHQVFDFWSTVISDAEPNRTGGPRTAFLSYVYSLRSVAVPSS
jgi:hypothetical protein